VSAMRSGQRLRDVRLTQVMSQVELAARVGISQQALSLIERGQSQGRVETWKRIAAALNVSEALFNGH
jgi:transcriptional regulator with XRE-family HTH domain